MIASSAQLQQTAQPSGSSNKGCMFTGVKKDADKEREEEEKNLPIPTYEEYLCKTLLEGTAFLNLE